MKLLADTNIVAAAVRRLRCDGHDLVYVAERFPDPGDAALLAEAVRESRVLLSKDHDIGELVFRSGLPHAGILLLDDFGDPKRECALLINALFKHAGELERGAFLRLSAAGVRKAKAP